MPPKSLIIERMDTAVPTAWPKGGVLNRHQIFCQALSSLWQAILVVDQMQRAWRQQPGSRSSSVRSFCIALWCHGVLCAITLVIPSCNLEIVRDIDRWWMLELKFYGCLFLQQAINSISPVQKFENCNTLYQGHASIILRLCWVDDVVHRLGGGGYLLQNNGYKRDITDNF